MKNAIIGVLIFFGLVLGFGLLGEKSPPPPTAEQKQITFAKQDFDQCMSKFNSMSERDQVNSGIANKCMELRNRFEAMELEERTKKK